MDLHVQMATNHRCYKYPTRINIKGIAVHSTGCNNPNLRRYVAPDDGELGKPSSAHWNQNTTGVSVHAFIGKLANGNVATYQVLPWNYKAWHAGVAKKGGPSANSNYISFEICEDDLKSADYFNKVYREAVELCAYLCNEYNLDPKTQIWCHSELHKKGIASNHADVMHWFPKYGKSMDTFRADVEDELEDMNMSYEKFKEYMNQYNSELAAKNMSEQSALYPEFETAKAAGITDGSAPYGHATRAQVAVMIQRAVGPKKD